MIINANNFSTMEELYNEIKIEHNLDALNDIISEQKEIIWINIEKSKKDLGYNETKKYYQQMLKKCHKTNKEEIKKKLKNINKGQTLFDIIIEIINENCKLITK